MSTRLRGLENPEEPRCAKPLTAIVGRPKSRGSAVFGPRIFSVLIPRDTLGSPKTEASPGKKPLRYRFHPNRASFTFSGETVLTQLNDTNCVRMGALVFVLGRLLPPPTPSGKL